MKFEKVDVRAIPLDTMEWLKPIASVRKVEFDHMVHMVFSKAWDLRTLPKPADGVAVTYPYEGKLFIYYLRGRGLFGTLKGEDLLQAARDDGLSGVMAETNNPATLKLLLRVGFKPIDSGVYGTVVELPDGQQ